MAAENIRKHIYPSSLCKSVYSYTTPHLRSSLRLLTFLDFCVVGIIVSNFLAVDDDLKTMIEGGMDEWEKHSCIRFTEKILDFNYLRFRADKEG